MANSNVNKTETDVSGGIEFSDSMKPKGITREKLLVVASILATEFCERLSYSCVVVNLVLFCTTGLKLTSDEASNVSWIFSGLVLLLAAAINYIAWFGSSGDLSAEARRIYFFIGLAFVAIGTGGIKSNVGPFGAQQLEDLGQDAVRSFFNWFYWLINAGGVIASSAVAYIQQDFGFDYGFLVPVISLLIALSIFVLTKGRYKHQPPGGSILSQSFSVCAQGCNGCSNPSFNHARKQHGGRFDNEMVDGVISVIRVLPIFGFFIIYWAIAAQMSTSLFLQSERMNIAVGGAKLPVAILNIFDTLIILILIPIMDRLVYPLLAKIGRSPSYLQRIGIGMVLAACAMLYAGLIEIIRKQNILDHGATQQTLAKSTFNASELSMFVQVPEFALMGCGEVFIIITGIEFAYTQAPVLMKGVVMGVFLLTASIGSYLSVAVVAIAKAASNKDWFPKEPNDGHMEYLLFLLAGMTVSNLIIFVLFAKRYKYRTPGLGKTHFYLDEQGLENSENFGARENKDTQERTRL